MTERVKPGLRRFLEIGFWVGIVAFFWTLDTLTKLDERGRAGRDFDEFRLFANQATSAVAVMVMVLFVAWWLRQFPLDRSRPWPTVLLGHLVGTGLFAVGHYALMVALRRVVYGLNGIDYMPDQNHLPNLIYEYKKDIKIYVAIVAIIATYRYLRGRAAQRGEEAAPPPPPPFESPAPKLAVQSSKGEVLLDVDNVDFLVAARNYVAVHAAGKEYLVRSPLGELAERLPDHFVRTHRSYLVNVERVEEVRRAEGAVSLRLASGDDVPVSRGYRDELESRVEQIRL